MNLLIDCPDAYVQYFYKVDCHKYIIKEETSLYRKVSLIDNKDEVIETFFVTDIVTEINVETPKDGVYVIKIEEWNEQDNVAADPENILLEIPIYDICEAEACYLKLVNALQCCDISTCDDDAVKDAEKVREALNRITGLMYFINKYIRVETDKYLGIDNIDSTREEYIERVENLFDKLAITIEKCNSCFGEDIDTGCKSCN